MDLAHAATSLAVHMMGARPPRALYKKEEDWESDRVMATSFHPAELLVGYLLMWSLLLNCQMPTSTHEH
jgi:hypothetical protein